MDDFLNPIPTPSPQPPPTTPITPTQTDVSHHLGQKGDILSLFGSSSTPATSAPGPPSNPTSPIGDFEGGLAPPSGGSLILSNSFTEPGPVELDPLGDMFGDAGEKPAAAETSQLPTFYIDESDSAKKEANGEAAKVDETVNEEATTPVAQQQTSRFWSWWSRSKSEAGSKENILEEGEKKLGDEGEMQGRNMSTIECPYVKEVFDQKNFGKGYFLYSHVWEGVKN